MPDDWLDDELFEPELMNENQPEFVEDVFELDVGLV